MRELQCPNCGHELVVPKGRRGPWSSYRWIDPEDWWRDFINSRWGGVTCDNCPAVIRIKTFDDARDYFLAAFLLVFILGSVSIIISLSVNMLFLIPLTFVPLLSIAGLFVRSGLRKAGAVGEGEIIRMRPTCWRCGAVLDLEAALICRKCGSKVAEDTAKGLLEEDQVEIPETGVVGACIVCNLNLDADDDLLFCPHCGHPAHKSHLLEWLHVKNRCPSCGEKIDEREIGMQLSKVAAK